jgi:hypothetical protein
MRTKRRATLFLVAIVLCAGALRAPAQSAEDFAKNNQLFIHRPQGAEAGRTRAARSRTSSKESGAPAQEK